MVENKLVSIIIPTYKRANMLPRTINSLLNQTYKNIEIIVVDDNEPDSQYRKDTEKTMKYYAENSIIHYIKHDKNKNGAAARNTGMKVSKGEYLCFLDDDDIFYEDKILKQVKFLEENLKYDAVYCARKVGNKEEHQNKEGNLTYELLSGTSLIITLTIMIRRKAAFASGGWDETFKRNQEAAFLLRFFSKGYLIGYIDEVLCETDLTDRNNALNAEKNHKQMEYYLEVFKEQIEECDQKQKNAKKHIYCYRYWGIVLDYLKEKKYVKGIMIFLRKFIKYPYTWTKIVFKYIINRLKKILEREDNGKNY